MRWILSLTRENSGDEKHKSSSLLYWILTNKCRVNTAPWYFAVILANFIFDSLAFYIDIFVHYSNSKWRLLQLKKNPFWVVQTISKRSNSRQRLFLISWSMDSSFIETTSLYIESRILVNWIYNCLWVPPWNLQICPLHSKFQINFGRKPFFCPIFIFMWEKNLLKLLIGQMGCKKKDILLLGKGYSMIACGLFVVTSCSCN